MSGDPRCSPSGADTSRPPGDPQASEPAMPAAASGARRRPAARGRRSGRARTGCRRPAPSETPNVAPAGRSAEAVDRSGPRPDVARPVHLPEASPVAVDLDPAAVLLPSEARARGRSRPRPARRVDAENRSVPVASPPAAVAVERRPAGRPAAPRSAARSSRRRSRTATSAALASRSALLGRPADRVAHAHGDDDRGGGREQGPSAAPRAGAGAPASRRRGAGRAAAGSRAGPRRRGGPATPTAAISWARGAAGDRSRPTARTNASVRSRSAGSGSARIDLARDRAASGGSRASSAAHAGQPARWPATAAASARVAGHQPVEPLRLGRRDLDALQRLCVFHHHPSRGTPPGCRPLRVARLERRPAGGQAPAASASSPCPAASPAARRSRSVSAPRDTRGRSRPARRSGIVRQGRADGRTQVGRLGGRLRTGVRAPRRR